MIIGCIGDRGSGKTLFMTYEAFNHYKNGKLIWSNYNLTFPKINDYKKNIKQIPNDFFKNFESYNLKNIVMLLDEIHTYIDARNSGSKVNKIMSYFFNQSRKTGVDIYYTTQFFSQIDKRLRYNTEMFIIPKCMKLKINDIAEKYIYAEICNRDLKIIKKVCLKAKSIYPLYNTKEIITFQP